MYWFWTWAAEDVAYLIGCSDKKYPGTLSNFISICYGVLEKQLVLTSLLEPPPLLCFYAPAGAERDPCSSDWPLRVSNHHRDFKDFPPEEERPETIVSGVNLQDGSWWSRNTGVWKLSSLLPTTNLQETAGKSNHKIKTSNGTKRPLSQLYVRAIKGCLSKENLNFSSADILTSTR